MLEYFIVGLVWLLQLGFIALLAVQQVMFSKDWELECDFDLKVWCTVWVARYVLSLILFLGRFHLILRAAVITNTKVVIILVYLRRLVDLFGFAWWLYGIKPVLVDGDSACNRSTVQWGLAGWYLQMSLMILPCIGVIVSIPFFCYHVRRRERAMQPKPTPSTILDVLETHTWKEYREIKENKATGVTLDPVAAVPEPAPPAPAPSPSFPMIYPSAAKEIVGAVTREISGQSIGMPLLSSAEAEEACAICRMEYEDDDVLVILPCAGRHYFHKECAVMWLQKSQLCPMCRGNIVNIMEAKEEGDVADTSEQGRGDEEV